MSCSIHIAVGHHTRSHALTDLWLQVFEGITRNRDSTGMDL